jgi:hypothetical protein
MRISDVSNVTGVPLSTLKDLRHRSILELAAPGFVDDPDEMRRWGSFSAPAVICIMGADEVRKLYGLSWQEAIMFVKTAMRKVWIPGSEHIRFFDLRAVDQEIWVGRFDFQKAEPDLGTSWNYFSGPIEQVPSKLAAILQRRDNQKPKNDVAGCIMINASRLVREFWDRAKAQGALRDWENR